MGPGPNATQTRANEESRRRTRLGEPPAFCSELPPPEATADPHEAAAAFVRLALGHASDFGFPEAAFLDALFAAPSGRPPAAAVVRALACRALAERSAQAAAGLPLERASYRADGELAAQGVHLARVLASGCAAAGGDPDHPFWELAFVHAFEQSLRSGDLLRRLAGSVSASPDLTERLRAALALEPLAGAVDDLDVDPSALAARHQALATGAPLLVLPFAATLHLRRVNGFLRRVLAEEILEVGVSPGLTRRVRALVEEAGERDLAPDVLAELREDSFACVEEAVAWGGDVADAVACCAGLHTVPHRDDGALRQLYLCSIGPNQGEVGSDVEEALIEALGEDPEDLFALEQLAQHLDLRGDQVRALRVVRYLVTLRYERERFLPLAG